MDRDPAAFRALYEAHYGAVCRYLARRVDPGAVEDVAAETFLVAWRRQADIPAHVLPWLLTTASKLVANQRRSRERSAALLRRLDAAAATDAVQSDLATAARRRALLSALASLREGDRELLLLRHWDGLAPREAATVLGLGPVLVRTRMHRAERRLRTALRAALEEEDIALLPIELTEVN